MWQTDLNGGYNSGMSDKLVTVATYWNSIEAGLARGRLEAAGIRSFLADDQMVGTAWYLGNAIGGIKLQVIDSEAEAALAALSENDADAENLNGTDDADVKDAASEGTDRSEAVGHEYETALVEDDRPDEPERALTSREENADRAYRGAIIGLLLFPLQLYVFWLLLKVFIASDEQLRPSKRRAAILAAVINIPCVIALAFFWRYMYLF